MGLTVSRGRALAVSRERMLRNEMGCNDPVMVTGWCPGVGQSEARMGDTDQSEARDGAMTEITYVVSRVIKADIILKYTNTFWIETL